MITKYALRLLCIAGGLTLSLVLLVAAPSSAVTDLTVTPGVGLSAGNEVTVTWNGSRAEASVAVRQCVALDDALACATDPTDWTVVPAAASGSVPWTVAESVEVSGAAHSCGTNNCSIQVASDLSPGGAVAQLDGLEVAITFGPAPYDLTTEPGSVTATQPAPTVTSPASTAPPGDVDDDPSAALGAGLEAEDAEAADVAATVPGDLAFTGSTLVPLIATALTLAGFGIFLQQASRRRS